MVLLDSLKRKDQEPPKKTWGSIILPELDPTRLHLRCMQKPHFKDKPDICPALFLHENRNMVGALQAGQ